MRGLGIDRIMSRIPHAAAPLMGWMLRRERPEPGDVAVRDLVPTWRYDIAIIAETADCLGDYASVQADVPLIGGERSPAFLTPLTRWKRCCPTAVGLPCLDSDIRLRSTNRIASPPSCASSSKADDLTPSEQRNEPGGIPLPVRSADLHPAISLSQQVSAWKTVGDLSHPQRGCANGRRFLLATSDGQSAADDGRPGSLGRRDCLIGAYVRCGRSAGQECREYGCDRLWRDVVGLTGEYLELAVGEHVVERSGSAAQQRRAVLTREHECWGLDRSGQVGR